MAKKHPNGKVWRLVEQTGRAVAGRSWRRCLHRFIGRNPWSLRAIYDREVASVIHRDQVSASMRKLVSTAMRDNEFAYMKRREALAARLNAIDKFDAETRFIEGRDARGDDGSDEIFAQMLADLQPMENA